MNVKKGLFAGVIFAFLVMGFVAMQKAMPAHKEQRIYKQIELYSPYKLEKVMGGLAIIDKRSGSKETPSAADVMLRFDELNSKWGNAHLKVDKNQLIVYGDNNQSITKIFIENKKERDFLHKFYGI